jgi:phosphoribosylglycinamide formyltransferase 1
VHKKVLGVLVSGRGSNLQAILDAINADRLVAKIGVVISDNPEANALRRVAGMDIPTAVVERKKFASKEEFEAAIIAQLDLHHVELVVLAGFMRILSPRFLNRFPARVMNIHPALLPSFPGLDAQAQALRYGVKIAGATVHFVDEGMDSGPIILQEAVPVEDDDTVATLSERILHLEHRLYVRAIRLYCEERILIEGRAVKILPPRQNPREEGERH